MNTLKKIFTYTMWALIVVAAATIGLLSWVFFRPKARCPKCGNRMKRKKEDESFGVWMCKECKK